MQSNNPMEPNFSTLVLSIASTTAMSLGLAPNPVTNKIEKDLNMAQYNIDLLLMLKDKTKSNLSPDEKDFLDRVLSDLQMRFVDNKK